MKLFGLNLLLALFWLFLDGQPSPTAFAAGFALGFALLALLRPVFPDSDYVRRALALVRFTGLFLRELLLANLTIARAVLLQPRDSFQPDFITYDVAGLSPGEILLLSHCITLTPGTTTVLVSDDFQQLVLHALDARDPDAVRRAIDENLRAPMLRFTR